MSCIRDGKEMSGMDCADLIAVFGTNNPCIYWDYEPSTQLTALIYPIFELSLVLYLVMSHFQIKNDMLNGIFPADKETLMTVLFWLKLVLVAWFRMIFVCKVTDDDLTIGSLTIGAVTAHTIGFLGLQVGLVFIAFENVIYLTYRKQSFWCFSRETTVKLAYLYLVLLTTFTVIKMFWTIRALSIGIPNTLIPFPVSEFTNKAWLLFAAVLPIFFALEQMKKDPPMVVTLVNTDVRK
eukprot:CAMPEP_0201687706 /NCGR_PEP_ID=MMETSP0578-20130828/1643_1 /ASSEMBLY_ACC=CAM_ASM_000663 /TAXON_ID=267565 /ORGANISM="Skeletonema grethea, Strain CCMP 1804" /LENGTH=236 /DNA_ID=CAMNT_0048171877 /DNA_START=194 /DNA_END=904 /DNA_ORIENTATION=+